MCVFLHEVISDAGIAYRLQYNLYTDVTYAQAVLFLFDYVRRQPYKNKFLCRISGSHRGDYEERWFLGCETV